MSCIVLGGPEDHTQVQQFVRRTQKTQHVLILMAMIYYDLVKGLKQKQQREKANGMKPGGNQAQTSKSRFPVESQRMCSIRSAMSCDYMCKLLSTRKAHWGLMGQGFY